MCNKISSLAIRSYEQLKIYFKTFGTYPKLYKTEFSLIFLHWTCSDRTVPKQTKTKNDFLFKLNNWKPEKFNELY